MDLLPVCGIRDKTLRGKYSHLLFCIHVRNSEYQFKEENLQAIIDT